MVLGAKHVESPFIELGQISTVIYFAHFLIIVPLISLLENSLTELASYNSSKIINLSGLNFKSSPILRMPILETVVTTGATASALAAASAIRGLVPFVYGTVTVVISIYYLVDFSGADILALKELVDELMSLHEFAYEEYDKLADLVNEYEETDDPLLDETNAKYEEYLELIKKIVGFIRRVETLIEPLDPDYECFDEQ
jgi:hypothetical protein